MEVGDGKWKMGGGGGSIYRDSLYWVATTLTYCMNRLDDGESFVGELCSRAMV